MRGATPNRRPSARLAAFEREDVHAVPLEAIARLLAGRGGRPLAHDETVPRVEAARREREVGPVGEDRGDVLANRIALGVLAGRVVLEHHARRVHRDDRVDVVRVPCVVVARDRLLESRCGVRVAQARKGNVLHPADRHPSLRTWTRQVGALRTSGSAGARRGLPRYWCWFQLVEAASHRVEHGSYPSV